MIRDHAEAIKAILQADADLVVFDGEVPPGTTAPPRYVAFYLTTPQGLGRRLSADAPKARFLLSTMYVGNSPNEVRWVAEHVHAALVRDRIIVAGRVCDPFLPPDSPAPVRKDDDINPPAWVATDVWPFTSSRVNAA